MMRVADICCGAGYFSHGFKQAGYEVDYGVDNWRPAIETYNKFIGNGKQEDLSQFYPGRNDYDVVVIGGTPCQDFSRANKKRNIFSKRAQLVLDYCRIIEAIKPEAFVFENVMGLAKWAEAAMFELKDYKVTKNIVDTTEYGVPQYRKRKIFIGSRSKHIRLQAPMTPPLTVGEVFSEMDDNWGFTNHSPETIAKFKEVHTREWVNTKNGDYSSTIRLQQDEPACTVVNVKKFQILHPTEDRSITIAEAMALQGIPPWYIPLGSDTDKAVQIANAVPPTLAYHIAKTIKTPYQRRLG